MSAAAHVKKLTVLVRRRKRAGQNFEEGGKSRHRHILNIFGDLAHPTVSKGIFAAVNQMLCFPRISFDYRAAPSALIQKECFNLNFHMV